MQIELQKLLFPCWNHQLNSPIHLSWKLNLGDMRHSPLWVFQLGDWLFFFPLYVLSKLVAILNIIKQADSMYDYIWYHSAGDSSNIVSAPLHSLLATTCLELIAMLQLAFWNTVISFPCSQGLDSPQDLCTLHCIIHYMLLTSTSIRKSYVYTFRLEYILQRISENITYSYFKTWG